MPSSTALPPQANCYINNKTGDLLVYLLRFQTNLFSWLLIQRHLISQDIPLSENILFFCLCFLTSDFGLVKTFQPLTTGYCT